MALESLLPSCTAVRWTGGQPCQLCHTPAAWPREPVLLTSQKFSHEIRCPPTASLVLLLISWSWIASEDNSWTPGLNSSAESRGVLTTEGRLFRGLLGGGRLETGLGLECEWVFMEKSPRSHSPDNRAGSYFSRRRRLSWKQRAAPSKYPHHSRVGLWWRKKVFFRSHLRESGKKKKKPSISWSQFELPSQVRCAIICKGV